MTPTSEQSAILSAVAGSNDNLTIRALAGTGKTSTFVLICNADRIPTLALAFNKRNATDLQERMPPHVTCKTLSGLGYGAWGALTGKRRLTVNDNKDAWILKELLADLSDGEAQPVWENLSDMLKAIKYGKECGWLPEAGDKRFTPLLSDADFFHRVGHHEQFGWDLSSVEKHLLRKVAKRSVALAWQGTIDFADMLLLPTICPSASFPTFDRILVDEAQDLSSLNHAMLKKIVKRKRLIVVGDPCQAIYGFRGAHQDSMTLLAQTFNTRELLLSVSFRCARAVAEHVRWRAPDIKSPEWAVEGEVLSLETWGPETLPAEAAIICRNNAPLFGAAMRLLISGRRPKIIGNDITQGLVKDLKKLGKPDLPQEAALAAFDLHAHKLRTRYKNSAFINDKLACMSFFLTEAPSLGLAIANAERILTLEGPIQLLTGHKSKGMEYDNVFFLDEHLIDPVRGGQQEENLRYVICTRAKRNLTYITSASWTGEGVSE